MMRALALRSSGTQRPSPNTFSRCWWRSLVNNVASIEAHEAKGFLCPETLSRLTATGKSVQEGRGPFRLWPFSFSPRRLHRRGLSLVNQSWTRLAFALCTDLLDSVKAEITGCPPGPC